ncbi:SLBB domain-containing protein [Flavobacteriaceae bacterium]|nr:SLBB domain-containing protein [Flavobacteriaceae bacterium]
MIKIFKKYSVLLVCVTFSLSTYSQNFSDLSGVNFSDLNSSQIDLILRRASSQGYNQFDLLKIARSQGMSQADLEKLDKRFKSAETVARVSANASTPLEDTRLRKRWEEEMEVFREVESDIFGYEVFRGNTFLSFQSNLNIPTPLDYVIGPGDKLFIDIYGESENYYQSEVSPDGDVILENIGPVNLSGLSLVNAKRRLLSRFKSVYSGINNKTTFVNISVGIPRAVRVNIVGEVNLPGTYNFSAFNTVYNAIYVAGGINENATLREVKLYRNNRLVNTVDVYKFLTKGDGSSNIRLENNDLIVVGPYTNRVTIEGAVKIPGRFEIKENESLSDLLSYSGGLSENAFKKSIKLTRIIDDKYKVVDVNSDQFDFFQPKPGDKYVVDQVIDKYNNRVIIKGAVYRPGTFSITEKGMTVKDLIDKAEGLKSDVFLNKAYITRTNPDYSTSNISINLKEELKTLNFKLEEEDIVNILSLNDLREEKYIEISGEVNSPGIFPYSKNISLQDIILLAGGFNDNATGKRIEINRMLSTQESNENKISEILTFDLNKNLEDLTISKRFEIMPFDQIIIRKNPNYYVQQYARIEGEVKYPGKYAISSKNERISDFLERAGGFKNMAYLKGATLIRLTEFAEIQSDLDKKIASLNDLKKKMINKSGSLTESEILLLQRIEEDVKNLDNQKNDNQKLSSYAKTERINEIVKRNSVSTDIPISKSEAIGIDLESIIKSPGSKSDLLLKEGDVIIVPKKLETVRLRGELLYPTTVRFLNGKSLKYYIDSSGGFDSKAKRSGTYVVYANGDVARTKRFLLFNIYPKAEPGCEVIVPKKALKNPIAANQLLNFTTGLATLILAINQIN